MRVLGLDPGLRHTGWGVIDVAGNRLTHVADGVIHAATDEPLATISSTETVEGVV